ncbi:MAG: N,N-dimethylformamidase beta subunit family domain-containing protein, partial [Gammaproteobacteria bacterium]
MRRGFGYLTVLFCTSLLIWSGPVAANCAAPANPIEAENCQVGNPSSEWDISGAGSSSIQGFATQISVNRGALPAPETVFFKVKTNPNTTNYRLDIYRLGYYGGMGARKVATVPPSTPQSQPACLNNASTGLIDCGNWTVSASWTVPDDATSGIYFAKLVRNDTGAASHIVFVVRDDVRDGAKPYSDLLFQTSDTTWQAYNNYGGNSLYVGSPAGRAYKVSYNRPFNTRSVDNGQDWLFNAEYPMVRW